MKRRERATDFKPDESSDSVSIAKETETENKVIIESSGFFSYQPCDDDTF